jgi:hypothetical protein
MTDGQEATPLDQMFEGTEPRLAQPPPPEDFEEYPDDELDVAPRRRVPFVTRILLAGIALALAFTAGVLVQKHHDAGISIGSFPGGAGGMPGFLSGAGGMPDFSGGLPAALGGSSQGSGPSGSASVPALIGTVVAVHGSEVIVRDLGGKEHRVHTTGATIITRSDVIKTSDLSPGVTVLVSGKKGADGGVFATAVTTR